MDAAARQGLLQALTHGGAAFRRWLRSVPTDSDDAGLAAVRLVTTTTDRSSLHPDRLATLWDDLVAAGTDGLVLLAMLVGLAGRSTGQAAAWRPLVERMLAHTRRVLADDRDPLVRILPQVQEGMYLLRTERARAGLVRLQSVFLSLPREAPLRHELLGHVSVLCALHGLLRDLEPAWSGGSTWQPDACTRHADAVERGDLTTARQVRPAAQAQAATTASWRGLFEYYLRLEILMDPEHPAHRPAAGGTDLMRDDLRGLDSLLRRDRAGIAAIPLRKPISASLSAALLPVYAALARGELDSTREMLLRRRDRTLLTPSDELLWALWHVQTGQPSAAAPHLEAALSGATHHASHGRLDFDLALTGLSLSRLLAAVLPARRPWRSPTAPPVALVDDGAVGGGGAPGLVGMSPAIQDARRAIAGAAAADGLPVLVRGATGTGKGLAARAIHDQGPRRSRPFIELRLAGVDDDVLLAELFGHEAGAFAGPDEARPGLISSADGGTLVLDEISDASPRVQAALLRLIDSGDHLRLGSDRPQRADCRLIATTAVDLDAAVAAGRFRGDLRYRLERLVVRLPDLSERGEDLGPLLKSWLPDTEFTPDLLAHLAAQPWPGNVRELHHAVLRLRAEGGPLRRIDRQTWLRLVGTPTADGPGRRPTDAGGETGRDSAAPARRRGAHDEAARHEALLALFRSHGRLTRAEVMARFRTAGTTASADLAALTARGVIEKVQPTPAPRSHYWRLRDG